MFKSQSCQYVVSLGMAYYLHLLQSTHLNNEYRLEHPLKSICSMASFTVIIAHFFIAWFMEKDLMNSYFKYHC